jgi:peptidoglycan DL-endopeptidase CwlO
VDSQPVAKSSLTRRCATAAVSVLAAGALLIIASSAGAQPQPTVSQVQAKLKSLTYKQNWLGQRYDQVSEDLASARQRLALVDSEVRRDLAAVQGMRDQIAEMASTVYEDGSMTSVAALLTSGNAQTLLGQSAFITHLTSDNDEQLREFITTDRELISAREMAQRTEAAIAGLKRQLAKQKAALNKLVDQQKSILSTLTAQQQQQVKQQGIGGGGTTGATYKGPTGTQADEAVAYAYAQIGCPYVYGGTGPCADGFDCSGLTMEAWAHAGVAIPRTSYGQATLPSVSLSNLQPGDILEFAGDSHVGIYVGGGDLIDAPQTGMDVEKVPLSGWYSENLDAAVEP